jgi:hypothetical protein
MGAGGDGGSSGGGQAPATGQNPPGSSAPVVGATNPGDPSTQNPNPTGNCKGTGLRVMACNAPQGTYVALEDAADRDPIANELWTLLTNAPCWYMEGTTTNYRFYGNLQYVYSGITADNSGGTLGVVSVGRFENKNASVLQMSYDTWLLVAHDPQTFTIGKMLNGQPYIETYRASFGVCA